MAIGVVLPNCKFHGWDNNGDPISGGLLYTYAAGTSTPLATYSDVALAVPNTNPVVLDSAGRATVFLTPTTSYKFVLKDALGSTTYWTQDDITVAAVSDVVTKIIEGSNITITSTGTVAGTGEVTINNTGAVVPTGAILPYGGAAAPSGYFLCDGTAVNRVTYAALFLIVGTAFGVGDGVNTFNLPDLRQRFPIGLAASGTGSTLGGTGGTVDHVHTGPSHTHTGPSHTHTGPSHTHTGPSHTHAYTEIVQHTHAVNITDGGHAHTIPTIEGVISGPLIHPVEEGTGAGTLATSSATTGVTATTSNPAGSVASGTTGAEGTGATGASGTGATGAEGTGATGASGTGNTGTGNPPFQAVNYIIKT